MAKDQQRICMSVNNQISEKNLHNEKSANTEHLCLRLQPQQKKLINAASKILNMDTTKFILQATMARAENVLARNTSITMDADEFVAFDLALSLANQKITSRQTECLTNLIQTQRPWE